MKDTTRSAEASSLQDKEKKSSTLSPSEASGASPNLGEFLSQYHLNRKQKSKIETAIHTVTTILGDIFIDDRLEKEEAISQRWALPKVVNETLRSLHEALYDVYDFCISHSTKKIGKTKPRNHELITADDDILVTLAEDCVTADGIFFLFNKLQSFQSLKVLQENVFLGRLPDAASLRNLNPTLSVVVARAVDAANNRLHEMREKREQEIGRERMVIEEELSFYNKLLRQKLLSDPASQALYKIRTSLGRYWNSKTTKQKEKECSPAALKLLSKITRLDKQQREAVNESNCLEVVRIHSHIAQVIMALKDCMAERNPLINVVQDTINNSLQNLNITPLPFGHVTPEALVNAYNNFFADVYTILQVVYALMNFRGQSFGARDTSRVLHLNFSPFVVPHPVAFVKRTVEKIEQFLWQGSSPRISGLLDLEKQLSKETETETRRLRLFLSDVTMRDILFTLASVVPSEESALRGGTDMATKISTLLEERRLACDEFHLPIKHMSAESIDRLHSIDVSIEEFLVEHRNQRDTIDLSQDEEESYTKSDSSTEVFVLANIVSQAVGQVQEPFLKDAAAQRYTSLELLSCRKELLALSEDRILFGQQKDLKQSVDCDMRIREVLQTLLLRRKSENVQVVLEKLIYNSFSEVICAGDIDPALPPRFLRNLNNVFMEMSVALRRTLVLVHLLHGSPNYLGVNPSLAYPLVSPENRILRIEFSPMNLDLGPKKVKGYLRRLTTMPSLLWIKAIHSKVKHGDQYFADVSDLREHVENCILDLAYLVPLEKATSTLHRSSNATLPKWLREAKSARDVLVQKHDHTNFYTAQAQKEASEARRKAYEKLVNLLWLAQNQSDDLENYDLQQNENSPGNYIPRARGKQKCVSPYN